MIEIKLSQGVKPGHGGMLLKTTRNAKIRNVPPYQDVISPHKHLNFLHQENCLILLRNLGVYHKESLLAWLHSFHGSLSC